jgi:hypothetical protein
MIQSACPPEISTRPEALESAAPFAEEDLVMSAHPGKSVPAHHRRVIQKTRTASLIGLSCLLCLAANVSCMRPHHTEFQVPVSCIQFTADSFAGPCRERGDGKIVCERVVVTASCVQANKSH